MSGPDGISIVRPASELREPFLEMAAEYSKAGESRYAPVIQRYAGDFDAYVRSLDEMSRGINLNTDQVPQDTWWLVVRDDQDVVANDNPARAAPRILGVARLRHRLNEALREWGGHIGYDIRPSERRKGYGTRLLSLALERARARGLDRVMLTCDATNVGSIGVIVHNGGKLENESFLPRVGVRVRKYWIEL
jgi:predicted acetyltransferase